MPPATAMWLSLISMASSRPKRWLNPQPQRTAYFSSARRRGRGLRQARAPRHRQSRAGRGKRRGRGGRSCEAEKSGERLIETCHGLVIQVTNDASNLIAWHGGNLFHHDGRIDLQAVAVG